jgi:hypothetical protein
METDNKIHAYLEKQFGKRFKESITRIKKSNADDQHCSIELPFMQQ